MTSTLAWRREQFNCDNRRNAKKITNLANPNNANVESGANANHDGDYEQLNHT